MLKTIGIGGQLMSGKDTIADYLAIKLNQLCNETWCRNAFARKLKTTFGEFFNKDQEWIEKWKREDAPPPGFIQNVRQCLIGIGHGFRLMHPTIWIEKAFDGQKENQIISDCRYKNELSAIKAREGISILLWRKDFMNNIDNPSEQDYMEYILECLNANFEGIIPEGMNIPFNMFIKNDGTTEDLYKKVNRMIIPYIATKWKSMFKTFN